MSTYFLFAILLLGFVITFQIAKASEYVGILKGENKTSESNNRINGFLMIVFLVLGLVAAVFIGLAGLSVVATQRERAWT